MMKAFLCLSLVLSLLICSCSSLKESSKIRAGVSDSSINQPLVLDSLKDTQIFDVQMNYKKEEYSGMLIVKRENSERFRVVLTSHFGMTVFDMEIFKQQYIMHYCLEPINKQRALTLLKDDFLMLLKPALFSDLRYQFDTNNRIQALENRNWITKTIIYLSDYDNMTPKTITIDHPFLKLKITLKLLPDVTAEPI